MAMNTRYGIKEKSCLARILRQRLISIASGYDVSSPSIGYRTNGGDYPDAFSYYAKEVDGLTASKIPQGDIDFWLSCHYPVYAVLLVHKADWVDGDIEVTPEYNFESKHCAVLIGKKDGYYIGVNSWGTSWGYNGLFHLYNLRIVGSALDFIKRRIWFYFERGEIMKQEDLNKILNEHKLWPLLQRWKSC